MIKIEYNVDGFIFKKELAPDQYFHLLQQKQLSAIIANDEKIEEYTQKTDSLLGKIIKILIQQTAHLHYEQVTCDTLPTINNPHAQQPSSALNNLPLSVRTYVMTRAYDNINENFEWIKISPNVDDIDIHGTANLVATANDVDGTFHIWDLTTRTAHTLSKKSVDGTVKFSSNGSQLITGTLHQKKPLAIHIDIWNCHTKKITHTIERSQVLSYWYLENKSDNSSTLVLIDGEGSLLLYTIKENTPPMCSEYIKMGIKNSLPSITHNGDYGYNWDNSWLYKKCTAYYLCAQAIQNTTKKESLPNTKTASLYLSLTPYEKNGIEKRLKEKEKELTTKEELLNNFRNLLG